MNVDPKVAEVIRDLYHRSSNTRDKAHELLEQADADHAVISRIHDELIEAETT